MEGKEWTSRPQSASNCHHPPQAQTCPEDGVQYRQVSSSDGVTLTAYEAGNPAGPEILFIHGFSQCSHCWVKQFEDPALQDRFRLTALDIRGHGASDKPLESERYAEDRQFADDVHAIMDALALRRPVLVGWSYAGRIVEDYLAAHGTARLAASTSCARAPTTSRSSSVPGMITWPA